MPRRSLLDESEDELEINLSPMIDCIFILLIFFIVTTVFVEEAGIQLNKPDSTVLPSNQESKNVAFTITANSKVLFKGQEIALAQVNEIVRNGLIGKDTPVSIEASGKSRHGLLVAVWDRAKQAGAEKLSFSTID
jgi:biopolymer transport protein ExbD